MGEAEMYSVSVLLMKKLSPHLVNEGDQHCRAREKQSPIPWSLHIGVLSEVHVMGWQTLASLKQQLGPWSGSSVFWAISSSGLRPGNGPLLHREIASESHFPQGTRES